MAFVFFPGPTATTTPVFPTLPGFGFPVKKTPIWAGVAATKTTGTEVRVTRQVFPVWQFDVINAFLRDQTANQVPYSTYAGLVEWEKIAALYAACRAQRGEFYYSDPEDSSRNGAILATAGTASSAATNAGTTSGNVLHFASTPAAAVVGSLVADLTANAI